MNKAGIADRLTARTGLGKSVAKEAVDGEFAVIGDALADGEEVRITGFGTFGTRNRPARTGRNESTPPEMLIADSNPSSPQPLDGMTAALPSYSGQPLSTASERFIGVIL